MTIEIIAPGERAWETDDFPLCLINIRVDILAKNLGLPLDHWEADGLGEASGFVCRLPSGLVVLAQEFAHAVKHLGHTGPSIHIDAAQFVVQGGTKLLVEVMNAFGLSSSDIRWIQSEEAVEGARVICASAEAWRRGNSNFG